MSHDPTRPSPPAVADVSDDDFLRAVHRAEMTSEVPSEVKMQELAERLGPILAAPTATSFAWRWPLVVAAAGVLVASATIFARSHTEASPVASPPVELPSAPSLEPRVPAPPTPSAGGAAPGISVDALPTVSEPPTASDPPRARKPAAPPTCTGEIELLDRADAALRGGDATRALSLAGEHGERCPSGVFVQERERIAIEALARLGRDAEVRERARPFLKRFPSSPHARRIRSLAGESE